MSNPSKREFDGHRTLITGASGSIGSVVAKKLCELGSHVILTGRETEKLEKLASILTPGNFTLSPYDLKNTDGIAAWMMEQCEKDGPFSGIAHTAGIQINRPLRAITSEFIDNMLHINVTSGIMLGKGLRQRACHIDGASFVLVSAMAHRVWGAGNVAYAASKGGVVGATKALAHELLRDKIRVNCVTPGLVESNMAELARKTISPESWQTMVNRPPMGIGSCDDVAHSIIYLLSHRTRWMTGTELLIEGGVSIS